MEDWMDGLVWNFRKALADLLKELKSDGVVMKVTTGLRSPQEQARLWRQSRSAAEVEAGIAHLKSGGAYFLAEVLEMAGPCHGPAVTRALPGLSWHQWGEAADCVWLLDGVPEWSVTRMSHAGNGYRVYAERAEAIGLTAGGKWPRFPDYPHVQRRSAPSPLAAGLSLKEIDETMRARFSV